MLRIRPFLVATFAIALAAPATVLADHPGVGEIFAVGDHVLPGETMTILGGQLEPGDELELRLTATGTSIDLGKAVVSADGTITLSAVVPASMPVGYATITATDNAGSDWTANVLIGERAEGPQAQGSGGPLDERVIGLLLLAVGLVIVAVAGWAYLRSRTRSASSRGG